MWDKDDEEKAGRDDMDGDEESEEEGDEEDY